MQESVLGFNKGTYPALVPPWKEAEVYQELAQTGINLNYLQWLSQQDLVWLLKHKDPASFLIQRYPAIYPPVFKQWMKNHPGPWAMPRKSRFPYVGMVLGCLGALNASIFWMFFVTFMWGAIGHTVPFDVHIGGAIALWVISLGLSIISMIIYFISRYKTKQGRFVRTNGLTFCFGASIASCIIFLVSHSSLLLLLLPFL